MPRERSNADIEEGLATAHMDSLVVLFKKGMSEAIVLIFILSPA